MKSAMLTLSSFLVFSGACASARPDPRPAAALSPSITERGDSVYLGRVFPLAEATDQPTYVYERRVAALGDARISTHVTRDLAGRIQLAESATHSADYVLADYALHANQLGQSGSIHVRGDEVVFRIRDGEQERTQVERKQGDVVVGPTLVGHIVRHLPRLSRGQQSEVRLAILDRLETIGFALEQVPAEPGLTRIKMSPTSVLLRMAIDPIYFTFERATQKLVRLEGRVPPKVVRNGRLNDFDARVEYQFAMASYR